MGDAKDDRSIRPNIPAAILIALVVQLGGTVWWAARMDTRLDINDKVILQLLARIERLDASNQKLLIDVAQAQAEIRQILRRDDH